MSQGSDEAAAAAAAGRAAAGAAWALGPLAAARPPKTAAAIARASSRMSRGLARRRPVDGEEVELCIGSPSMMGLVLPLCRACASRPDAGRRSGGCRRRGSARDQGGPRLVGLAVAVPQLELRAVGRGGG